MQVQEHVVPGEQRAQPVRDPVLEVLRRRRRRQIAVEVPVAEALLPRERERIRHRDERDLPGQDLEAPLVDVVDDATDRDVAARLVAVDGARDDEPRP